MSVTMSSIFYQIGTVPSSGGTTRQPFDTRFPLEIISVPIASRPVRCHTIGAMLPPYAVRLIPHDPAWADQASEEEARILKSVWPAIIEMHHGLSPWIIGPRVSPGRYGRAIPKRQTPGEFDERGRPPAP